MGISVQFHGKVSDIPGVLHILMILNIIEFVLKSDCQIYDSVICNKIKYNKDKVLSRIKIVIRFLGHQISESHIVSSPKSWVVQSAPREIL